MPLPPDAPPWAAELERQIRSDMAANLNAPLPVFAKANLPAASSRAWRYRIIKVSDDVGGETIAYSNGTNWLRTDRAVIS